MQESIFHVQCNRHLRSNLSLLRGVVDGPGKVPELILVHLDLKTPWDSRTSDTPIHGWSLDGSTSLKLLAIIQAQLAV